MMRFLVLSDDAGEVAAAVKSCGYSYETHLPKDVKNPSATKPFNVQKYAVALLDLNSEEWQRALVELRHRLPVIAFSQPDIRAAVEAMKLGACDYLERPMKGEALKQVVDKCEKGKTRHANGFAEIIGMSRPMQEVFGLIERAAVSESNVLITGDSGTGKEPVARAIHRWSPRKENAFMTINCSAIPDTLLESELFGFEKGAFTGANYTKKGIFELADRGTVFLDEIGDVSPLFQTKVLRVLQEGEIMRIGGLHHMRIDVRVIAATNKDLKLACRKGMFREDLFYRLNVINIHLPPLRERMEDVPLLVKHFIEKHGRKRKDILIRGITDDAIALLMNYPYPGNVRELENIIERAISFANFPDISLSDLPAFLLQGSPKKKGATPRMKEALIAYEREIIWSALQECQGNISKAAATLGVYRQQLQRMIRRLKIVT